MIKKIIFLIIFSLALYFVISKNIGNGNLKFAKDIIPNKYHTYIKKIFFPNKYITINFINLQSLNWKILAKIIS